MGRSRRPSVWLAAAACLGLAAVARAAHPFVEDERRMDELQVKMAELQKQAEENFMGLARLQGRYGDLGDLARTRDDRAGLRARLEGQVKEHSVALQLFNGLRERSELQKVALGLQLVMKHGKMPDNTGKEFVRANMGLEAAAEGARFQQASALRIQQDDDAFRVAEARAAEEQRRMLMVWGVAGAAVLVVLLVALLLTARRLQNDARTRTLLPAQAGPAAPVPALAGPASDFLEPGQVLDENYRVEKELGRGGMGVVYSAMDLALQRPVAIKLMQRALAQQEDELGLFLTEARLVAQLKHPNLVEIYAIHRQKGRLALIFELVDGHPLSRFLAGGRRLPLAHVKPVMRQVAAALDYAHAQKVIHRDLKPANVMVAKDGKVKVMDFGIAYQAKLTVAKATRVDAWGTPAYMAPEQELGRISRESDVFAMGVMAYEMLVGRIPFVGPNFLAQKQQGVYAPAGASAPGLPPAVDALFARALAPDPGRRFRSAGELAGALEALAG